jgi:glucokinase
VTGSSDQRGIDVVLGLDLGGTQVRAAAVGPDGVVGHRASTRTPVAEGPDAVVEACIAQLAIVRSAVSAEAARARRIVGIGISAPGPVDPFRGVIVDPPNLGPGFQDVHLAERVADAFGLPTFLDRDTQVAALGEGTFGAARGCRDFIYLTVSTGVGGAVVSDGRMLRGPDGAAGELGHLLVDRSGPVCGCGARGHLEAIASGVAIARAAREVIATGGSPALAEAARSAGPAFGAREVVAAAAAGDPAAARIVADACDAFAQASVALVDVFNPALIVVGGSLAGGLGEALLGPARRAVADRAFRMSARRVRFAASELGDDVGLIGAAVLVDERHGGPVTG